MDISGTYKIVAYEPETSFAPSTVEFVKTLRCGDRDDLVWAKSDSSLGADNVILASRHEGSSLLNIVRFPIHVYVCLPKHDGYRLSDSVPTDEISIRSWGLLLELLDDRTDLEMILLGKRKK